MVRNVSRKGSQPLAFGYALDLRLPAVFPELLKAADPQTRRVPSCHSRPPDHAGRGIAGIAQVEPDDAHPRRFAAASNPRTGTRPQALCGPRPPGSRRSIAAAVWRSVA